MIVCVPPYQCGWACRNPPTFSEFSHPVLRSASRSQARLKVHGMIHHRRRLPLRPKPCDDLLGVHPQLDHLQSDASVNRLGLLRGIDHAATALAHPLQQPVTSERLADGLVQGLGEINLACGWSSGGRVGQRRARLFMSGEHRFKTPLQCGITSTRVFQERTSVRAIETRWSVE
jgi:hypothetical protein